MIPLELVTALALVLVIEGLLLAVGPSLYRDAVRAMAALPTRRLRAIGLSSMIAGAVVLVLVR